MAPILFAIGIHGAIAKVAAKFPGTHKVWTYLDNVTFAGEPKVCGAALEALQREIKILGLRLNVAKCKVDTRQSELSSEFLNSENNSEDCTLLNYFSSMSPTRRPDRTDALGQIKCLWHRSQLGLASGQFCGRGRHRISVRDPRAGVRWWPKNIILSQGYAHNRPLLENGGFCLQKWASLTVGPCSQTGAFGSRSRHPSQLGLASGQSCGRARHRFSARGSPKKNNSVPGLRSE